MADLTLPTESAVKDTFKLGRMVFAIENCNPEYQSALSSLLPPLVTDGVGCEPVTVIKTGCDLDIRALVGYVAGRHSNAVAISASCLVSREGRRLLIAGMPKSGKTATCMTLALGHGWKVFTDGVLLIDYENSKLIPFAIPFIYDESCSLLVEQQTGKIPASAFHSAWGFDKEIWSPAADFSVEDEADIEFDLAIFLTRTEGADSAVSQLSSAEYLRKLLPLSNLLRVRRGSELMSKALTNTKCLNLTNIELGLRLEHILQ